MTHDFATLSCNVYHIHQAEEAAKQTTAHQCRIQGWAEGTTLEMQAQKIKEWIESKLPGSPMRAIQHEAYGLRGRPLLPRPTHRGKIRDAIHRRQADSE